MENDVSLWQHLKKGKAVRGRRSRQNITKTQILVLKEVKRETENSIGIQTCDSKAGFQS